MSCEGEAEYALGVETLGLSCGLRFWFGEVLLRKQNQQWLGPRVVNNHELCSASVRSLPNGSVCDTFCGSFGGAGGRTYDIARGIVASS